MNTIKSYSRTSTIAGLLILLGMIVGILSVVPSIESSNYLIEVSENRLQVLSGAFFQSMLCPIYLVFAILLYPILNKYNQSLAIGFIGLRIAASVFQLIGALLLPLFVFLSQEFTTTTSTDLSGIHFIADLLKILRDLINHVGMMMVIGIGNLILYYVFFKMEIIPRWLSSWGVLGNVIALFASILLLLQIIGVTTLPFVILTIPLVFQEIILALWLILKGFKLSENYSNNMESQNKRVSIF